MFLLRLCCWGWYNWWYCPSFHLESMGEMAPQTQASSVQSWEGLAPETEKGPPPGGQSELWEAGLFVPYSPACQGGRRASPTQTTPWASLWAPSLWKPRLTGKARKLWVFKVLRTLPLVFVKIHCSYLCVRVGKKTRRKFINKLIMIPLGVCMMRDSFCPLMFSAFSKFSVMSLCYLFK